MKPSSPVALGINHHLLYPEAMNDPSVHESTLKELLGRREFQVVDCFLADDFRRRQREVDAVRSSGKYVVYNCPLLAQVPGLDPSSPDEIVRGRTAALAKEHVRRAKMIPTLGIVVASGPAPADESSRAAHIEAFSEFLFEVAIEAGPIPVLVEPFDTDVDKRFVIGPTEVAVRVVRRVRDSGPKNVGLLIDMGHLPLLRETFEHALYAARELIGHVHLGNCILSDPSHALYGDRHPPIGIPGGEHTEEHLRRFLAILSEVGYLNGSIRALPTVTLEQRPYPGKSEEESIELWLDMLNRCWPGEGGAK